MKNPVTGTEYIIKKGKIIGKKECKHKNKAYSSTSYSNNNGTTSPWICKDCGFEGEDFVRYYSNNEYEETRRKFGKYKETNLTS